MDEDTIIIKVKQPFYTRIFSKVKSILKSITFIKREKGLQYDSDFWHGLENDGNKPFRWSHPITKIYVQNLNSVVLCILDPLGRDLNIIVGDVNRTVKLKPDLKHKLIISTHGANEISFRVDPFNPDNDSRSLGIQCYYVCSEDSIILN